MPGEAAGDKGDIGVGRAKRWLERTTRVRGSWTRHDAPLSELLEFDWPHGGTGFSFDLGGRFCGGEMEGKTFVAEVKNYSKELDLANLFRDFLAKCYIARQIAPDRCDSFLWISWAPFKARDWDAHESQAKVVTALTHKDNEPRALAGAIPDYALAADVSTRISRLTMSEKLEELVIMDDHYNRFIVPELYGART